MKHGKEKIFLLPGDYIFRGEGAHIHTLLGSCIAITLWHPEKKIGGMCHFTLPGHPTIRSANEPPNGRYAEDAMALFKESVKSNKTRITEYQAKIFGGGNMIKNADENVTNTIGAKNSVAAMKLLIQEGVEILVAHVGEFGHRRIVFDISTGEIWVKHKSSDTRKGVESLSGRV